MKSTVTLMAETESGLVHGAPTGVAEGKTIVAAIQTTMATTQVKRHRESLRPVGMRPLARRPSHCVVRLTIHGTGSNRPGRFDI